MPRLTRKSFLIKLFIFIFIGNCHIVQAQTASTFQELENLIDDALILTERYITPAADAAVYQAASSWVNSPKKTKLWDFNLGLHVNTFVVPNSDRTFQVSDSELNFFDIQNTDTATLQTALGNRDFETLIGQLDGNDVSLRSPEGINMKYVVYPFMQASLGLPYGVEFISRYAPKTYLKNVTYQVYGFGLKYNLSQYFEQAEAKNINFSAFVGYSNEDISVNFLDVQTEFGNLGLNSLNSKIDTWQAQINVSKTIKKVELSAAIISNTSNFKYKVDGDKGSIESIIPLQDVVIIGY
jgi:hypothetical protein